ncbi:MULTISPECIES: hypothetical protein [Amycolatopsis]|uniref:Uncharacterized protein n=1 Tax=Amycolatopsis albidoflavus TaxID=102226 RepID=A0ABW5I3V4_9PSEU
MTETQENPLVAKSESPSGPTTNMGSSSNELDNLNAQTSGAGIVNDLSATQTDFRHGDWGNFAVDVATDGLDLLGVAMDPLGSLASAGVGWLIEHISFLKEGLDQLAGNPEAVTAKAVTWANIGKQLAESADKYEQAAAKVAPNFQGQGGQAYQGRAKDYAGKLRNAAGQANGASTGMNVAAALVGTERGLIRDMISSFVGELIVKGIAALASSWCTFGGTVAAFIADTVVEGGILAEKIGTRIAKVVEKLDKLAESAGKSKAAIEQLANAMRKAGKAADKIADKSVDVGVNLEKKAGELKDAGKAESAADKAERWKANAKDWVQTPLSGKVKDRVNEWGDTYSEDGRQVLSPKAWEEAKDGAPKWSPADTAGVGAETRRQENEQYDRYSEASEKSEKERKAEEAKGGSGE